MQHLLTAFLKWVYPFCQRKLPKNVNRNWDPTKEDAHWKHWGSEPSNSRPKIKQNQTPLKTHRGGVREQIQKLELRGEKGNKWWKRRLFILIKVFSLHTRGMSEISDVREPFPGPGGGARRSSASLPGEQVRGKLIIIIIANTNGEQFIIKPFPALSCRSRAWCSQIQLCGELRRRES